jgi:nucleotide-binding universal stress UspA family protein
VDYLDRIGAPIRETGLSVTCSAHEGSPADHITNEAERTPDTLIAMVTHGRSGVGRWVLGSITDKVLHGSTSPLLITHARDEDAESSDAGPKNIIAPLDGSKLAEQAVPHVEAIAKALELNVVLVRVTA